jgi:hypothetical protein
MYVSSNVSYGMVNPFANLLHQNQFTTYKTAKSLHKHFTGHKKGHTFHKGRPLRSFFTTNQGLLRQGHQALDIPGHAIPQCVQPPAVLKQMPAQVFPWAQPALDFFHVRFL